MKILVAVLFASTLVAAQTVEQPGMQYAAYTVLLVPQQGTGFMVGIDKQQKIIFVPIPEVNKSVKEDGVSPVHYGELLQLLHQLGEENQRLKAENDHLWKVAENRGTSTPVIVEQAPAVDPNAQRQQMRMMLLRSLLAPRYSTMNVNVTDCSRTPALCVGR